MNIMLIDDDEAIRDMLQDIIEDYELGTVVASLPSAANLTATELIARHIDLLIIDMLMPDCDGIDSVRKFHDFPGKIIMLSQVVSKDLIGKAYESGVYAYITKPLNRNEIISVLHSAEEHIRLERFAHTLQSTLQTTLNPVAAVPVQKQVTPREKAAALLKELGVAGTTGYDDLIEIIDYLQAHNNSSTIPSLKTIFTAIAKEHAAENIQKEAKTIEQRLRRAVFQAMVSTASMGVVDYTNPKFEEYAPFYFDYAEVCSIMRTIQQNEKPQISKVHINTKKFIQALYTASSEH
ncbi:response regulator [Mitsuokella sp.]|uniref:response regulator n=1 Tax=unclassified Mitsuokella TaxID=2637239 RepID=UPI003D7D5C26